MTSNVPSSPSLQGASFDVRAEQQRSSYRDHAGDVAIGADEHVGSPHEVQSHPRNGERAPAPPKSPVSTSGNQPDHQDPMTRLNVNLRQSLIDMGKARAKKDGSNLTTITRDALRLYLYLVGKVEDGYTIRLVNSTTKEAGTEIVLLSALP